MQENLAGTEMGFKLYKPHFKFEIDTPRYQLLVADRVDQLLEVFALRQRVFFGSKTTKVVDFDLYDSKCDHMIVIEKETQTICGTYRIAVSSHVTAHYSQLEFKLDDFLELPGNKMELGRAAISPNHRNGRVLDLLWQGLATYAWHSNSQFLFGCSSIMTTDRLEARQVFTDLQQAHHLVFDLGIHPTKDYDFDLETNDLESSDKRLLPIPPLLLSYLRAGSKVYGRPALDQDFGCIDFMTILNLKDLTPFYKKRYFRENA